eukprot:c8480_g1_i2.p1 GENE.c8480_g1_i2~~c8480_g1_i2.p1  ORF type:complete len:441 (-),score=53.80 c8480_g1_i2:216-1493(-)
MTIMHTTRAALTLRVVAIAISLVALTSMASAQNVDAVHAAHASYGQELGARMLKAAQAAFSHANAALEATAAGATQAAQTRAACDRISSCGSCTASSGCVWTLGMGLVGPLLNPTGFGAVGLCVAGTPSSTTVDLPYQFMPFNLVLVNKQPIWSSALKCNKPFVGNATYNQGIPTSASLSVILRASVSIDSTLNSVITMQQFSDAAQRPSQEAAQAMLDLVLQFYSTTRLFIMSNIVFGGSPATSSSDGPATAGFGVYYLAATVAQIVKAFYPINGFTPTTSGGATTTTTTTGYTTTGTTTRPTTTSTSGTTSGSTTGSTGRSTGYPTFQGYEVGITAVSFFALFDSIKTYTYSAGSAAPLDGFLVSIPITGLKTSTGYHADDSTVTVFGAKGPITNANGLTFSVMCYVALRVSPQLQRGLGQGG